METETTEKALTAGQTFGALLVKHRKQIEAALPNKHLDADRMIRIAMTACQKTPKLLQCHPVSLFGAIIQAAQLGLEVNDGTGKAWLVPFFNKKKNRMECQMIPGYRGLVQLARNSGRIGPFEARVVHKKDLFEYQYGVDAILKHRPSDEKDIGPVTHFYAVAKFTDGMAQFDVMKLSEVNNVMNRSKSRNDGPWKSDFDEMGKKTVVRRLSKMLPASAELHRAVTLDEQHERHIPQDLALLVDETETGSPEGIDEDTPMPKRKINLTKPAAAAAPAAAKKVDKPADKPEAKKASKEIKKNKKTAPGKPNNAVRFLVYVVASTKVDGRQAYTIRSLAESKLPQRRFFTREKEIATLAKKALTEKSAVFCRFETEGDRDWISDLEIVPAAK